MAAQEERGAAGADSTSYTYESQHLVYAMNWSVRPDKPMRLGVASFREEPQNYVQLIQVDEERGVLAPLPNMSFRHDYPPTKLMFVPDRDGTKPDLLATTGEFLRLWRVHSDGVQLERLLTHGKSSQFTAPLTSFDWSEVDTRRLGVSSLDTTCTIWDLERGVVDTQLIAHDKEVYDICWGGPAVFGTVSADGSVRIFDLRDKEHSTIIYETGDGVPLLKLAWNKQDPRYLATVCLDSSKTIILDIRYPSVPCMELWRHTMPINCVAWAPHTSSYICTAGDDSQVLIWELGLNQGSKAGSGAAGAGKGDPAGPAAAQGAGNGAITTGATTNGAATATAAAGAGTAGAAAAGGGEGGGGAAEGAGGGAAANGAAGARNGNVAAAGAGAGIGAGSGAAAGAAAAAGAGLDPVLAYGAAGEINQLQWSSAQHEWLSICFNKTVQILRI